MRRGPNLALACGRAASRPELTLSFSTTSVIRLDVDQPLGVLVKMQTLGSDTRYSQSDSEARGAGPRNLYLDHLPTGSRTLLPSSQ